MAEQPDVRVGQVWESCDKRELDQQWGRGEAKRVRVTGLSADGKYADCDVVNAKPHERPVTRIRVDRFRPTSTGYRLVEESAT